MKWSHAHGVTWLTLPVLIVMNTAKSSQNTARLIAEDTENPKKEFICVNLWICWKELAMEDLSLFVRFLMMAFTLFSGLGFKSKKNKEEKSSGTQMLSSSAPSTSGIHASSSKARSPKSDLERVRQIDGAGPSGSPTSKTEPIAIKGRQRSATARSLGARSGSRAGSRAGSAHSLHSVNSVGSGGTSRRLGHGTPGSHKGSKSVLGSFISGSNPGSIPTSAHSSYSKSHEAVWNQAFMNSCRWNLSASGILTNRQIQQKVVDAHFRSRDCLFEEASFSLKLMTSYKRHTVRCILSV